MAYYILFVLAQNKGIVKRKRITYHVVNIAVADTLYGLGMFCSIIVPSGNETLLPFFMIHDVQCWLPSITGSSTSDDH